uniref:Sugar phosphate exchanger 3 n=1 Tax=Caenorhabditis japonica TaxID=281687 RepID=A0A8R1DK85_CAEJA
MSYAMLHATRKTLSTVKPSLIHTWVSNTSTPEGPVFPTPQAAAEFLGGLDTGFMVAYSIGLYVCGILGDNYNPRRLLTLGMMASSIVVFCFGYVTETFHYYSPTAYAILWISNGFIQSVGWPVVVSIMGNWFGRNARGAVMGAWSSCASVGNIIGTLITSNTLYMGYQYSFLIVCSILLIYSFIVFFQLPSAPWEVNSNTVPERIDEEQETERHPPIGFFKAWLLPGVIAYSLAYACLKLVNYGFFFWLPFYLHTGLHWPESFADVLSTWYDVGGIIAAVIAGALSDSMRSRTPVVFIMLLLATISLYIYAHSPESYNWNAFLLLIAGFFIGGPANMISSSITADLGKCDQLHGNAEALSTVTGIIDGTGSIGAAMGQWFIPSIQQWFGWDAVFYGFIVMILCTALCLTPVLWKEHKDRRAHRSEEVDSLLQEYNDSDEGSTGDIQEVRRRPTTANA